MCTSPFVCMWVPRVRRAHLREVLLDPRSQLVVRVVEGLLHLLEHWLVHLRHLVRFIDRKMLVGRRDVAVGLDDEGVVHDMYERPKLVEQEVQMTLQQISLRGVARQHHLPRPGFAMRLPPFI